MSKLLISYRRADTAAMAGRIRDRLALRFGEDQVFMDIDAIPIGVDFRTHLEQAVARADAVLVLIGADWSGRREDGTPRILEERDPIRLEVEAAFQAKRLVIPVLIDGAQMPAEGDLPPAMGGLAYINAAHVDSGRDFNSHMERLIRALEASVGTGGPAARRGAAAAPVAAASGHRQRAILIVALGLLVVAALIAGLVEFARQPDGVAPGANPAAAAAGDRDRIKQTCLAYPTPGLDCQCFADFMAAKLTPNQQLVLLEAMKDGSDLDSIKKAMADHGVDDPNFPQVLLQATLDAANACMAPSGGAKPN